MKVAEQRDGEAFQPNWPTPKRNLLAHDAGTIGFDQDGIGAEGCDTSAGRDTDKFAPGDGKKRQSVPGPYLRDCATCHLPQFQHNPNPKILDMA